RPMEAVRQASLAVGTEARARAILRAVLRDVAPVGSQSARQEIVAAVGASGAPVRRAVAHADARSDAADDETGCVFGGTRIDLSPGMLGPCTDQRVKSASVIGTLNSIASSLMSF